MEDHDRPEDRGSSPGVALASVLEPFSPMALHVHRAGGAVVGRQAEQDAIRQELASAATGRLAGLAVEGEPGIGKTRLLLAAAEMASAAGFTTVAVTADEELRGPFLLARSILGAPEAIEVATERPETAEALARSLDSMSGQDDPGLATLAGGSPAPAHVRSRRRRVPRPRSGASARHPRRRPPVGRRRQPAHAPLRGPLGRHEPDLPDARDAARGARVGDRGREPDRGHGADGPGPPDEGRPLDAAPRRAELVASVLGGPVDANGAAVDACAGRRCAVHRRGDGACLSRRRDDPADRRRLAAGAKRGAPGARPPCKTLISAPRRAPAGRDEGNCSPMPPCSVAASASRTCARSSSAWTTSGVRARRARVGTRAGGRRRGCSPSTPSRRRPTTASRTSRCAISRPAR